VFDRPILIVGAPRSGTSLTAGIIHLSKAWGGDMRGHRKLFRKSLFENSDMQLASKVYLKYKLNADPQGQSSLPDLDNPAIYSQLVSSSTDWRQKILHIIKTQGYDFERWKMPWFFKSSKTCLLWPMWHTAFPKAHWIIVKRSNREIAESCMKTGYMTAYSTVEDWLIWACMYSSILEKLKGSKIEYNIVEPERIIKGDLSQIKSVILSLNLTWREQRVKQFVLPELWKGGK
jgi:hypothetical protein